MSARAGSEAAYVAVAKKHAASCFFLTCDLNPSTKLGKAAAMLPAGHTFEMSIQEQAATLLTNGLAFSSHQPQLNVFALMANAETLFVGPPTIDKIDVLGLKNDGSV